MNRRIRKLERDARQEVIDNLKDTGVHDMGIEIPVTIFTDHNDPMMAYCQVREIMMAQNLGWESGDIWYRADGSEVPSTEITEAINQILNKQE